MGPTGSLSRSSSTGMKDKIPKGYKTGQLQQFTPEQINLFKQLFGFLGPESYLSKLAGGDESSFEAIEQPAKRQFGQALGGLSSRFSSMGLGGRHSTDFQNLATQGASDLSMNLASQRQQLQSQATKDLFELSHMLMGERPYQKFLTKKAPKENSGWGGLIGAGLGGAGGFFAGGPAGAMTGASLGYNVGSKF
jgi:hypothetical protein